MKRIFTSALIVLLTIGAAQAQTTSNGKHEGYKKEHRMAYEQLNLTAEQKARLDAIKEQHKTDVAALKNNTSLNAEQQKARRKELHKQYKTNVKAILTPEQKSQLEKIKTERKTSKGNVRQGRKSEDRGIKKEITLTAEQKTKMHQIRTDVHSRMQNLRSDNNLTQEQKRSKMQELMQQQREQKKAVLTKEQQEKMKMLKKERSDRNTK